MTSCLKPTVSKMKVSFRLQSLAAMLLLSCSVSVLAESKTITIQANDTLSKIVAQHYPQLTPSQHLPIMDEVLRNNEAAFVEGNIHRLIVGKSLNLPDYRVATNNPTPASDTQNTSPPEATEKTSSTDNQKAQQLETARNQLQQQVEKLEGENSSLRERIEKYETERKQLDDELKSLEQEVKDLQVKLKQQGSQQTSETTELLDKANTELAGFKEENQSLKKALEDAKSLLAKRDAEIEQLQNQINTLNTDTQKLETDLQATQVANTELVKNKQQPTFNKMLPWLLAGLSSLLLIALLWLLRRQNRTDTTTTITEAAQTPATPPTANEASPFKPQNTATDEPSLPNEPDHPDAKIKLNIARAYLDMRDTDAAYDILQEVLREGSNPQKQEAREILSFIA